jgi:hypothetical protein
MSLKEEISKFKENASREDRKATPTEAEILERSGILSKCLKAGDKAPAFSLPNQEGDMVSSADLLAKGPLVLAFYLGGW